MTAVDIDSVPFSRFHKKLLIYSIAGPFCDGYILGIVGPALATMSGPLHLTPLWSGLLGSSVLIGIFVGAYLFGRITDRVGRRMMYTIDLAAFVVLSALQFFVTEPWQLFVLRLLLGIAVGADYPIASSMLAEFMPSRHRGPALSSLIGAWWMGYVVAYVVGYVFSATAPSSWRWMLASSALPALIAVLGRRNIPESPRWLLSKGRRDEAQAVVAEHLGPNVVLTDEKPASAVGGARQALTAPGYRSRTFFVGVFWACQVMANYSISVFEPQILKSMGVGNHLLFATLISLFNLVGIIPAILLVNRIGRRPLLNLTFAISAVPLLVLALLTGLPAAVIVVMFIVFAAVNTTGSVLQWVYPNELFPTRIRASAVGFGTSVSRIGAAAGTFLLPIVMDKWGVSASTIGGAIVCLIGLAVGLLLAPETRNMSLARASQGNSEGT